MSVDDATRRFNTPGYTGSVEELVVHVNSISPRYFETMGIRLMEGRPFLAVDASGSPRVAILSQSTARQYFPGRSAVGAMFRLGRTAAGPPIEVIGVAGDIKQNDLRDQPFRTVYFPLEQAPSSNVVAEVRAAGDISAVFVALRQSVLTVNSEIPVASIKTIREQVDARLVRERLMATLSSLFGLLALSLAAVGLYGVVSYSVTVRTSEIGIRMALGADRRSVLGMVFREAGVLIAAGAAVGVLAAIGLTRLLADMLFGLTPTNPSAYLLAVLTLSVVAAVAAFIPAMRASMIEPIVALREG